MESDKHEHHAHKVHTSKKHKRRKVTHAKKKKTPWSKYVFGVVVFVVLVAVVVALIFLASKSGESRLTKQKETAAVVNGEKIMTAYLDEQYSRVPEAYKPYITKATLLNQTINEVVLLQEAKKQGITVVKEDVEKEIQTAMSRAGISSDQLDDRLKEQNITKSYLTDLYKKQLTINNLLEKKVFPKVNVSKQEIKRFYDSRVRAMHILVDTEKKAEDLIDKLKKSSLDDIEADFLALAKKESKDPSAATNGGDLGEFGKGQMVPEFEKAAFGLEDYSFTAEPVKSQFGYHVILRLPKNQTISEQASSIKELLISQKKAQVVPMYVQQLRRNAQIQVFYSEPAQVSESSQ